MKMQTGNGIQDKGEKGAIEGVIVSITEMK